MSETKFRVKVWEFHNPEDPEVGYLGEGDFLGCIPLSEVYSIEEEEAEFLRGLKRDYPSLVSSPKEEEEAKTIVNQLFERKHKSKTPKIRLDSGKIVYGCQIWWKAIETEEIE